MFKFIVLFAVLALAAADHEDWAEVKVQESEVTPHGSSSDLQLSDGTYISQTTDEKGNANGAFGWTDPKSGESVDIKYTADENGYVATGDAIPTPPPIPAEILAALEYIAAHPPIENSKDSSKEY